MPVFLDYGSTTPVRMEAIAAFERACRNLWANPSSLHGHGLRANEALEESRATIAGVLNLDPSGLHFCSSGTEAIHAGVSGYLSRNPGSSLVVAETEHPAVYHLSRTPYAKRSCRIRVDSQGRVDMRELKNAAAGTPGSLFLYSPVNHETGALQPVEEIYSAVKESGGVVFIDAVAALARIPHGDWAPFCDMAAASSHKIHAPKGSGFLWVRKGLRLRRCRYGGGQESGFFPGTENLPGIVSFAEAAALWVSEFRPVLAEVSVLSGETLDILSRAKFDWNLESPESRAPGILCLSLPWVDSMEDLLYHLSLEGVSVSRFSACSDRVEGESRVLRAMGRSHTRSSKSLRITLGLGSKRGDVQILFDAIAKFHKKRGSPA